MKKTIIAALLACASMAANATVFTVDAQLNSSSGGTALGSVTLMANQAFTVSVAASDLWSAGNLPRWSNADGLIAPLFATGTDDSGQAAGTLIGASFVNWSQFGHASAYGSLVGEIGGQFFTIGTSFSGVAPSAGVLNLYYWDSNAGDNTGSIAVDIAAIPEPTSILLMGLGVVGLLGARARSKKA